MHMHIAVAGAFTGMRQGTGDSRMQALYIMQGNVPATAMCRCLWMHKARRQEQPFVGALPYTMQGALKWCLLMCSNFRQVV